MRIVTMRSAAGLVLAGLVALSGGALAAQDATPTSGDGAPHPAMIHAGTCDELGEIVSMLPEVSPPTGPLAGQAIATAVETSVATVDLGLEQILASEHAINVHRSLDDLATYIACGEIGGARLATGALAIGLRERNDSGHAGVALLAPNAADPARTDVSVFLVHEPAGDGEQAPPTPGS